MSFDSTPKVKRKVSLSLGNRLHRKRSSPQHNLRPIQIQNNVLSNETKNNCSNLELPVADTVFGSPTIMRIIPDERSPEGTPRNHRSINYEDTVDFSPKILDASLSPSCIFSQTMTADSPEVDWRWNSRHSLLSNEGHASVSKFRDNCNGVGISSFRDVDTVSKLHGKKPTENHKREQHRKNQEIEFRREQATRAHEMLKKRCEQLHKQLEEIKVNPMSITGDSNRDAEENNYVVDDTPEIVTANSNPMVSISRLDKDSAAVTSVVVDCTSTGNDVWNDFMNDSDTDCFLLEATQQMETKIITLTQLNEIETKSTLTPVSAPVTLTSINMMVPTTKSKTYASCSSTSTITSLTPTLSSRSREDKRSSFYLKFLEDETPEDWFTVLDEAVIQANQSKKPRTSLQRYKSMPTKTIPATTTITSTAITATTLTKNSLPKTTTSGSVLDNSRKYGSDRRTSANNDNRYMKRHASTHALSSVTTNVTSDRAQLFGRRE